MPRHKVLLLGLGFWGEQWLKTLLRSPNCEMVGVSAGPRRIEEISQRYAIPHERGIPDYKEAIAASDADIVVITLPTGLHRDAAIRSLDKGMHVMIEKPLAASRAEADAVRESKGRHPKLKFMVCQNYRWRPHNQRLKRAIREGMIGAVGSVHLEFRQPECFIGYREFLPAPLLQDVCIHHFDLFRFFTGSDADRIQAWVSRPYWSRYKGNPSTDAIVVMKSGALANYHGTWAARGRETSWDGNITITGEKGCLGLDSRDRVRFYAPGDGEGILLENEMMTATELDYALKSFFECIEQDLVPETDLEDNYQSFAMACTAEESAKKGIMVKI